MPKPALPIPPQAPGPKLLAAFIAAIFVAGCQPASPHPVPSVPQIGGDLKCSQGDHGYEDLQAGWGFCYPGSWKYTERAQASLDPPGLDLTFDITNVPTSPTSCPTASGSSDCAGLFAFMIISTYDRRGASDLSSWASSNIKPASDMRAIAWGNAQQAGRLADGRRLALTQHHVVMLDLHSGLLDLESAMSARLDTWQFKY